MLHFQQTLVDVDAMSSVFKTTRVKSSIYFGLAENKTGLQDFKGKNLYAVLTWKDKLYCNLKKTCNLSAVSVWFGKEPNS